MSALNSARLIRYLDIYRFSTASYRSHAYIDRGVSLSNNRVRKYIALQSCMHGNGRAFASSASHHPESYDLRDSHFTRVRRRSPECRCPYSFELLYLFSRLQNSNNEQSSQFLVQALVVCWLLVQFLLKQPGDFN